MRASTVIIAEYFNQLEVVVPVGVEARSCDVSSMPVLARLRSGITPCMLLNPKSSPNPLFIAGALIAFLSVAMTIGAAPPETQSIEVESVAAHFRGCESAGWCRFWIESQDPMAQSLHRVYPDGIPRSFDDEDVAIAVRDRLNALLASMVHQHKRIVLHGLRENEDGTLAATVTVNEANVASDPILQELRGKLTGTTQ